MYQYFKTVSYPFTDASLSAGTTSSSNLKQLKELFIDFKLNIYNTPDSNLSAELVTVRVVNSSGVFTVHTTIKVTGTSGSFEKEITLSNVPAEELHRIYLSEAATDYPSGASSPFRGLWLEYNVFLQGFICLNGIALAANTQQENTILNSSPLQLEPARISSFYKHRVDSIICQNALPLIAQTVQNRYAAAQDPVQGHVKFQQGNNCIISVQPLINTVVLAAQTGANDSQEEVCGVWSDKVMDKDILCNEVVYTISGVEPDSNGDIRVKGDSPVTVNSLPLDDLPQPFQEKINNSQDEFSDIIRYIYVGLPSVGDSSVFDCPTV